VSALRLPLLEPHRRALESCVYCPKLSRAACPVANVEANETVTPWGKMSMAFFVGRGDVPADEAHAAPAWACSACYGCRERCEHKNEVAHVLCETRAEMFARGIAPAAAREAAERFGALEAELEAAVAELPRVDGRARRALLIGCSYLRHLPDVAWAAVRVVEALLGPDTLVLGGCCGLPLWYAGDRRGFVTAARGTEARIAEAQSRGARELWVLDPGCAHALLFEHSAVGVRTGLPIRLVVDLLAARIDRVPALAFEGSLFRWHDPCQLGRGLGRYDEPRRVLARLAGAAPAELVRSRAHAECSGGGGLLPLTRPGTSRAMAEERISEHRAAGGGVLVTHCAQSLRRLRSAGEPAVDLVALVAQALGTKPCSTTPGAAG
jgi:Fe-S oxidoreductase